jgi:Arc/MetJ-type ribon-helix-helix transcriptional regulator
MTMNISLEAEQEQLIQAKLQSGKYENAYQVIVAAFGFPYFDLLSHNWCIA